MYIHIHMYIHICQSNVGSSLGPKKAKGASSRSEGERVSSLASSLQAASPAAVLPWRGPDWYPSVYLSVYTLVHSCRYTHICVYTSCNYNQIQKCAMYTFMCIYIHTCTTKGSPGARLADLGVVTSRVAGTCPTCSSMSIYLCCICFHT